MVFKIAFAFIAVLATASAQNSFRKRFRVVSLEDDLNFIGGVALDTSVNGAPVEESILKGSRFLQNGVIYRANRVRTDENDVLIKFPQQGKGDRYTSECTALEGEGLQIERNICNYNLCAGDSCVFLRSGGNFSLNVQNQTPGAVPEINAAIIAGTGRFKDLKGKAIITQISVPANNGPSSDFPGSSVLEIRISGMNGASAPV